MDLKDILDNEQEEFIYQKRSFQYFKFAAVSLIVFSMIGVLEKFILTAQLSFYFRFVPVLLFLAASFPGFINGVLSFKYQEEQTGKSLVAFFFNLVFFIFFLILMLCVAAEYYDWE